MTLKDRLRLRRSRAVGLTLIFIIMFMIGGFFFGSPFVESFDNLAPPQTIPFPIGGDSAGTDPSVNIPVGQQPDQDANENPNEQVTSNSDLCTQIGDESGSPLYCSSNPLLLRSTVVKVDSNGVETTSVSRTEVPTLSFFVEDISNIDYSTGRLEISTLLENPEQATIFGSANFDILIDNQTIFISPVSVEWATTPTIISPVKGEFITSTGRSSEFIFQFTDHLDKFPQLGITPLEIKLSNVDITVDSRDKFGTDSLDLFRMNIATDPNRVIIVSEEGEPQVIFAIDDQLFFQSKQVVKLASNSTNLNRGFPCPEMGAIFVNDFNNMQIVSTPPLSACQEVSVTTTEPSVTAEVYLSGSVPLIEELIQRNSTYNIIITAPTQATFQVQTPLSQKNYSFYCIVEEESKLPALTAPLDNVYGQSVVTSSLTTENLFIVCNFPISGVVS